MTIAKKLLLFAIFATAALLLVGAVGIYSSMQQSRTISAISGNDIPGLELMHSVRSDQQQISINLFRHMLATDPARREPIEKAINELSISLQGNLTNFGSALKGPRDRELYATEKKLLEEYLAMLAEYLERSRSGQSVADMVGPMGAKRGELSKVVDEHLKLVIQSVEDDAKAAVMAADSNLRIALIVCIVSILLLVGLSYSVIRSINSSLSEILGTMSAVEGSLDFTVRARVSGRDEIAEVSSRLNRLLETLASSLENIAQQSRQVSTAAHLVNANAARSADAAREQSDAASSMAASIEEMTVSINHVGDRAQESRDLSRNSGDLARSGIDVIKETVSDINAIAKSVTEVSERIHQLEAHGDKISNIVSVIKEVADQTNLLALNAAIEAARAGEQGRGFAVVADEVRKLAERTAGSTSEIAEMVGAIRTVSENAARSMKGATELVEQGVSRAAVASDAIGKISQGALDTLEMAEEISSAIREQASASNSIAVAVERIAQMADEGSANSRRGADVATDLQNMIDIMQGEVSRYRIRTGA